VIAAYIVYHLPNSMPKSIEWFNQGERMWQTTDMPRYVEMCRNRQIACAARTIPPKIGSFHGWEQYSGSIKRR